MKRFFLTFLIFSPLMAFGSFWVDDKGNYRYDDVTIVKTMTVDESIVLNPREDIGFVFYEIYATWYNNYDEDALEISGEKKTTYLPLLPGQTINGSENGYYYIYTLKALKRGAYTFKTNIGYICKLGPDYGEFGTLTAHVTYKILVDVVKVGNLWYALDRETNTAEVTYSYDEDGYEFEELEIPSSITHNGITYRVTGIGEDAFWCCSGLTSVTIPNSVTSIGDDAFCGSGLSSVTIPNSVTSIGGGAFAGCLDLTSITIPNSVTNIGDYAFSGCHSLTSITIPNSVTSIGECAFYYCDGLTSLTIPSSVTSIGELAFCYSGLTSVIIPNSVTSIGDAAFSYCYGLTSVTIGNNVTSISNYAFNYCSNLTSIDIPNSVTSIGEGAFCECEGLTSVTIPSSVTSIGEDAFSCCFSLEEIYCYAEETPEVSDDSFNDVEVGDVTLYVPRNSYNQYKEHPVWGKFDIAVGTDIKQVGEAQSTMYNKIYNLEGRKLPAPQHGMNIIRHSDGTTRKVLQR